jgi:hypothetical protein
MDLLNPRDPAALERAQQLIARIAEQWKGDLNIIELLPVVKVTSGVAQKGVLAIGFFVRQKLPPDQLVARGWRVIPEEIENIPTDVISTQGRPLGNVDTRDTRSQMYDTLVGGIAVGNANMNAYGTLGMICFAQSDGHAVGLTNEHVLVDQGDGRIGEEVQQPRFYLNSEVSIENAACCPNGHISFRSVDNPIVDTAAGVFAAAAVAAALSDTIDPHRRGQDATPVEPSERTIAEKVSTRINYPELPFPGRPYKLDVKWTYQRQTDRRILEYSVAETQQNPHVLSVQELVTDWNRYSRGAHVTFAALLGLTSEKHMDCGNFFVTAAALSPSQRKVYRIILRPYAGGSRETHGGQHTHNLEQRRQKGQCVYWGVLQLATDEELGLWTTYLFAQTRNNIARGTDPLIAAQTIGGLTATNNYADAGSVYNITYGHACLIDIVPNGAFEVIFEEPSEGPG